MTEKEKLLEEKLTARKSRLDNYFMDKYPSKTINGELFFQSSQGQVFTIGAFAYYGAIQIEYADSFEKANGGREDGDLFSIDMSETDMLQAILKEIEG